MLKLLNIVAPAYFLCGAAVTFALQLFLFIPAIFGYPSTSIPPFTLFHGVLFLFLATNTMGNYILTILNPSECVQDSTFDKKATDQADGVDNQLIKATHFCKLCSKVIWKRDHHCLFTGNCIGKRNLRYFIMFCLYTSLTCLYSLVLGVAYLTLEYALSFGSPLTFLTLLPLAVAYFFLGAIPNLEMFLILMTYVWFGIGLACAGFSCQQVLLASQGQTRYLMKKGHPAPYRHWRENLAEVFGTRWILGIFLPVPTAKLNSHSSKNS
ncbi:palmitoyltransferase ZDHHC22-like [Protopterus annectens]|uniref:palmitoyltransferase ZDHHC22-like n=1 Tax=Protopterus annectens TaxID=7888 RepID=UPI001CFC1064|nr:palmitoyltransferase ZDHHC22-like [Protopterus annectens]